MERMASGGRIGTLRSDVDVVALVSIARAWEEWLLVAYQSSRSPMRADRSRQSSASSAPPRISLTWDAEKTVEASSGP